MLTHFIESKGLIATAAAFLVVLTQIQLGYDPHWQPYIVVVFFAAWSDYNLHRFVSTYRHPEALNTEKHHWVAKHRSLFNAVTAFSVIGLFISLLWLPAIMVALLLPAGLITLLYSIPSVNVGTISLQIRKIPLSKIFIVTFVWAYVTVIPPAFHVSQTVGWTTISAIFIERFLFVFALTIPFDIRDLESDAKDGLTTIPQVLGEPKSIWLSAILLVVFMIICMLHYGISGAYHLAFGFVLSGGVTLVLIASPRAKSLPYYHYGMLDSMLLLQTILVLGSYYFLWGQ